MSLSRELQLHITQLKEIRSILNAMKNLAFIELHKLLHFKIMQGQSVATIENVMQDFLSFHPCKVAPEHVTHFCVLLGAERGFCGDFNESLINAITSQSYTGIIAVGSRLCNRLETLTTPVIARLEGANVADEVSIIVTRLLDTINFSPDFMLTEDAIPTLKLTIVYHDNNPNQINLRQLFPPVTNKHDSTPHFGTPPILNLTAEAFFTELMDHYLFAALHEVFYISLTAENQRRLQHLEAAVNHLDDETTQLQKKSQIYRQEEITEEIEVILLNAENNLLE